MNLTDKRALSHFVPENRRRMVLWDDSSTNVPWVLFFFFFKHNLRVSPLFSLSLLLGHIANSTGPTESALVSPIHEALGQTPGEL